MARRPWFSFYAADWLADADVMAMSAKQRGVYIHLLAIQWREGSIPNHRGTLFRLAGLVPVDDDMEIIDSVLTKFKPLAIDPDRLVNPRLEAERQLADAQSAANSINGKLGGRPRRQSKENNNLEKATAFVSQSDHKSETKAYSQSQSQSQREKRARAKKNTTHASPDNGPASVGLEHAALQTYWLKVFGNIEHNLLDVKMRIEDYAKAHASPDVGQAMRLAVDSFAAWLADCPPVRRPAPSPAKFVQHFSAIQDVMSGRRKVKPPAAVLSIAERLAQAAQQRRPDDP